MTRAYERQCRSRENEVSFLFFCSCIVLFRVCMHKRLSMILSVGCVSERVQIHLLPLVCNGNRPRGHWATTAFKTGGSNCACYCFTYFGARRDATKCWASRGQASQPSPWQLLLVCGPVDCASAVVRRCCRCCCCDCYDDYYCCYVLSSKKRRQSRRGANSKATGEGRGAGRWGPRR